MIIAFIGDIGSGKSTCGKILTDIEIIRKTT
jgi:dephospho-CoA kinase